MLTETETILIVDDHPVVLDGLALILSELKPQAALTTAINGKQALQQLAVNPEFDWVFIDINLPDIMGLELVQRMRARKVLSNVVMLSSEVTPEVLLDGVKLNVNGILSKAFTREIFADCFNQIEAGQLFMTPEHQNDLEFYQQSQLLEKTNIENKMSRRQVQALDMLSKGYSNSEIAKTMCVTESTVKTHVSSLMALFGADNRTHCVIEAQRLKII